MIEEQLAERLGVSRTPVRQALTMLEAEGLVEIAPNRGATVCSFSIEDVWDIYDLRAVLEGHAARRAAGRIERRELARLRELAGEMEGLPGRFDDHEEEIRALVALNQEFHGTIVHASRNRRLENFRGASVMARQMQSSSMPAIGWWVIEPSASSMSPGPKLSSSS